LAGKFNQLSGRPLYGTYADGRASLSNSYAPMRTLTIEIFKPEIFEPEIFKSSSAKLGRTLGKDPSRSITREKLQ
jgi:hypothetical protein